MNRRLCFLFSFTLLSACMPVQKPTSDAFVQSELMPPKAEEVIAVEEPKKENDERSILAEILAAIKAPVISNQEPKQQKTQPVPQTTQPQQQPQTQLTPQVAPSQQPLQQTAQTTPPPVVLPQTSPNIMPQILQAAPNGTSSPFFQTIVLPQMAPFGYPTPMPAPAQPQPVQQAPFYSTPVSQTQNYTAQAPAQNLPVQPVNQQQAAPVQQPINQPQAAPVQQPAQQNASINFEQNSFKPSEQTHPVYQEPSYIEYQETVPVYVDNTSTQNDYYPQAASAEVILPDTYQLPQTQEMPTHVMSGQEAYPIWQSENETYYEEILPTSIPQKETSSLQSENINVPRW